MTSNNTVTERNKGKIVKPCVKLGQKSRNQEQVRSHGMGEKNDCLRHLTISVSTSFEKGEKDELILAFGDCKIHINSRSDED